MGSWLGRWFSRSDTSRTDGSATASSSAAETSASERAQPLADWDPALDIETTFVRWLLDAPAQPALPVEAAERRAIDALHAAAASGEASKLVPRVPSVVPQLLHSLRDPSRSVRTLAQQVSQDPVLVAAVLRAANSSYFRVARPVESLDQAVLVLGDDGLRQLVASVAFRPLMNLQSGHYTRPGAPRLWDQSERAGIACRVLAPLAGGSAFEGYLGSLLANVGNVVAMRVLDRHAVDGALPVSPWFCGAFRTLARDLGCAIGRQWAFPDRIADALAAQPPSDVPASPLAVLVGTAERLSRLAVLVDAGRVPVDEATRAVQDHEAIARCFDELRARAVAAA